MLRRPNLAPWSVLLILVFAVAGLSIFSLTAAEKEANKEENGKPPMFDEASLEFFEKQVRPLLVKRCYKCHGPETKDLKGGLRLDSRTAALAGGDTGPAVVPGNLKESLLIDSINYGEIYQMPPKTKMPAAEIAVLTKWVEMGAPWPAGKGAASNIGKSRDYQKEIAAHWCWQPVRNSQPPVVKKADWPKQGLDHFILAKLEEKGLSPSKSADRRTLIRRVYFDLIGLPPTPRQVEAFLNDKSPEAYEKVVDQLLRSGHFGERWGRHWMDLTRYAESYGHEFEYPIPHPTQYRDYLIRAFNADLPYDRLIVEHIAGDLVEDPRQHPEQGYNESVIGTGFWWLGEATHAPVDVINDEAGRIDNQLDVMSKTFFGLTVACARCHDHKFDPLPTTDYYALVGFLQSSRRQEALLDPGQKIAAATERIKAVKAEADAVIAAVLKTGDAKEFARYLLAAREVLADVAPKTPLDPQQVAQAAKRLDLSAARLQLWIKALQDESIKQSGHPMQPWLQLASRKGDPQAADFKAQRDRLQSDLKKVTEQDKQSLRFADFNSGHFDGWMTTGNAFGDAPTQSRQWDSQSRGTTAVPVGVAHSGLLGNRQQGVLRSPNFTLTHKNIHYRLAAKNAQIRLIIEGYFMDVYNGLLFRGISIKPNTNGKFIWQTQSQDVGRYIGRTAHLEIIDHGDGFVALDEIRFSNGPAPAIRSNPLAISILQDEKITSLESLANGFEKQYLESLAAWQAGKCSPPQAELIGWALKHQLFDIDQKITAQLASAAAKLDAENKSMPAPMHVLAMTDGSSENEQVFIRGNHRTQGDEVPRRTLTALGGEKHPSITQGSGRLHLAQQIASPDNPLTARVAANRVWHHLMGRGIVASVDNFGVLGQRPTHPELLDYLAGQFVQEGWSLKRLIRRIVLSKTYQMSSAPDGRGDEIDPQNLLLHRGNIRRLQGEAIRDAILTISGRLDRKMFGPSVPVHLTPFMQGRGRPRGNGPLDGAGRRSIYTAVRRNFLPPMMLAFDTPAPFSAVGRRNSSNVPAQALIMMNDPFVVGQAKVWAARLLAETDITPQQRIEKMYVAAFCRPPSESESAAALAFLDSQGKQHNLSAQQAHTDARVWTDLCHVMMNVKEFIFVN